MPDRRTAQWGAGPITGRAVLRGGSWNNNGQNVRSANRNNNTRGNRNNNNGFRVARPPGRLPATGAGPEFPALKGVESAVRVTMSPLPESGRHPPARIAERPARPGSALRERPGPGHQSTARQDTYG